MQQPTSQSEVKAAPLDALPPPVLGGVVGRLLPRRLYYGWYIAFAGATTNFFMLGTTVVGFGVVYTPMHEELGWSMAAIAAGISVRSLEQGIMSPFTGYLVDRLGPRRTAVFGVMIMTAGMLLFSQVTSLWMYYLSAILIGLGQSIGAINAFSNALMSWFVRKRGRAMGILNAGNGLGFATVPLLGLLVTLYDWRAALAITAILILVICVPLALLVRDRPEPYGYRPDGGLAPEGDWTPANAAATSRLANESAGMSVAEVVRTPAFWLLAVSNMAGATQGTLTILLVQHLEVAGFTLGVIGLIVSIYGLGQVFLRVSVGWLGDIVGRKRLLMFSYLIRAIGIVLFAHLSPDRLWMLPLFFVPFAVGHAGWNIGQQTITADYFGTRRVATIRGLNSFLGLPIAIASPIWAGWMFDQTGSYVLAFTIIAGVTASAALWVALIRRPMWHELATAQVGR